ncbi:MAG: diaminopimelate epimerase [Desulfobacteraceae bacterium]|nr:diaminopimelate epimerase [Desulfobacteraceae bacterium]
MELSFSKMQGLGNDFVMLDDRNKQIEKQIPFSELAKILCSRRFGIGGDGIILIQESHDHDMKFAIFNCDGSEAQMCGNGMRCFGKYLWEKNILKQKKIRVETRAGTIIPEVVVDENDLVSSVTVDMGEPILESQKIPFICDHEKAVEEPLEVGNQNFKVTAVSMGNPHAVIFVNGYEGIDLEKIGPKIETHERFPEKTNVEFIKVVNENELDMRVWERGAGITMACGTGACASLVAAHMTGRSANKAVIHLSGGDLAIEWNKEDNHIYKTGSAMMVFEGSVTI